jgi:peptidoglycan/xylan/chitin deacetylase (PgdA/CDA1 family)
MSECQVGVLGNVEDVCAALDVFSRVQHELAVSRMFVITREPQAMQTAIQHLHLEMEITVLDLDTLVFDSISPLRLLVNLSPAAVPALFEAALRAIPVVSASPVYMPPVFMPNESWYQFPYQELDALKRTLLRIAAAPEEANEFAREAQRRTIAWAGHSYPSRKQDDSPSDNRISSLRSLAKRALFALVPRRGLLKKGNSGRPEFALTFDDGPSPVTTRAVLATLRRYSVQATFFLIGNRAAQYPDLVKAIFEEGHEIGSHSHTHPYFHRLSASQAARESAVAQSVLEGITGQTCRLFRPPFGKLSIQSLLQPWLHRQCVVMWTVDLKDYKAKEAVEIENKAVSQRFVNGDIILYHGLHQASVAALPSVIEAAKAEGRTGVTVSDLRE